MADCLCRLDELPSEVLELVVRDGERFLEVQLTVELASDQRAFTFASLTLGAATAAIGASLALVSADKPNDAAGALAAAFALLQVTASIIAIFSARPQRFCLPGNEPENWLPEHWKPTTEKSVRGARLEQAAVLQSMIEKNSRSAKTKALTQRWAFIISFGSAAAAALAVVLLL